MVLFRRQTWSFLVPIIVLKHKSISWLPENCACFSVCFTCGALVCLKCQCMCFEEETWFQSLGLVMRCILFMCVISAVQEKLLYWWICLEKYMWCLRWEGGRGCNSYLCALCASLLKVSLKINELMYVVLFMLHSYYHYCLLWTWSA